MLLSKFSYKNTLTAVFILFVLSIAVVSYAEDSPASTQSYAKFDSSGQLYRPKGYREWIYIGSPLTPNDMNNGKAAFPEFHNVYIDPVSWQHWKNTGEFKDGTLIVKELISVGSKQAPSGNGYFQGEYIGLEASTKSSKHFPDAPGNWGYFRFTVENSSELLKISTAQPNKNCLACHQAQAKKDQVFTQYYPVLRASAGKGQLGTGGM